MKIKHAISDKEKNDLDVLLWETLWKPLNLPRDVRQSFKLDAPQIELIAINNGTIIGALVANWLSGNEIEIRHIAVRPGHQKRKVGKRIVETLTEYVRRDAPVRIQAFARNTSEGFFARLGFKLADEYLSHPEFEKHGITFRKVYLDIPQR